MPSGCSDCILRNPLGRMMDRTKICHPFPPVFDMYARVLILGSLPSVQSRQQAFYYGNPRNRFWKVLAGLTGEEIPQTVSDKQNFLLRHRIALWDVIRQCEIHGSSDASIRYPEGNDLRPLLEQTQIHTIFTNGATAYRLYQKLCFKQTGKEAVLLPSTSPDNAAFSLEQLIAAWRPVHDSLLDICTADPIY